MFGLDLIIADFFQNLINRFFILDITGIAIAKYIPFLFLALALVFVFKQPTLKKKLFVSGFITLCLVISRGLFVEIIRFIYERPRPFVFLDFTPLFEKTSWAFPSGHASVFFALAVAVYFFNKKWGWWFFGFAVINGISRIYVGVHWFSDILGGIGVGVLSFAITYLLLKESMDLLYKDKEEIKTNP